MPCPVSSPHRLPGAPSQAALAAGLAAVLGAGAARATRPARPSDVWCLLFLEFVAVLSDSRILTAGALHALC